MQRNLQETCFSGFKFGLGFSATDRIHISEKQFKYSYAELIEEPTTYFSARNADSPFLFPLIETWSTICFIPPRKWLAHKHNTQVEHVTCKIYWVRSTASFFSWRSRVSLSFTVMILTSPRRSSLRPRGRFRTHTLIFSLSVHGVSFSEVLDLQR